MNSSIGNTLVKIAKAWWNINVAVFKATVKGILWILTFQWLCG